MANDEARDVELLRLLPHTIGPVPLNRNLAGAQTLAMVARLERLKKAGLLAMTMETCAPGYVNLRATLTQDGAAHCRQAR